MIQVRRRFAPRFSNLKPVSLSSSSREPYSAAWTHTLAFTQSIPSILNPAVLFPSTPSLTPTPTNRPKSPVPRHTRLWAPSACLPLFFCALAVPSNQFRQLLSASLFFLMSVPVASDLSAPSWYRAHADCACIEQGVTSYSKWHLFYKVVFNVATVVRIFWRK